MRRTATLDFGRPDGAPGAVRLDLRARDLRTNRDGTSEVIGAAHLVGRIHDDGRALTTLRSDPADPELDGRLAELDGETVAGGFRRRLDSVVPEEVAARSLVHLLLDDLPGGYLVSGYALQRSGPYAALSVTYEGMASMVDLCAGWADDATLLDIVRREGVIAVPLGPPAPRIERDDDPEGWHATAPLAPHATRRRRCLDLAPGGAPGRLEFSAHFRDSHVDEDGLETVIHEYTVEGTVDAADRTLVEAVAAARVLPWVECPAAVASASWLDGRPLRELRDAVRLDMRGAHTCTHLNDTMRAVADLDVLVDARSYPPPSRPLPPGHLTA